MNNIEKEIMVIILKKIKEDIDYWKTSHRLSFIKENFLSKMTLEEFKTGMEILQKKCLKMPKNSRVRCSLIPAFERTLDYDKIGIEIAVDAIKPFTEIVKNKDLDDSSIYSTLDKLIAD